MTTQHELKIDGNGLPIVGAVKKGYDSSKDSEYWLIEVAGKRVQTTAGELLSQTKMCERVMGALDFMLPRVKPDVWNAWVTAILAKARSGSGSKTEEAE